MTDHEKLIDDSVQAFEDRGITAPPREHLRIALTAFDTSLSKCGCTACTDARRERTGLTDHDRRDVARALHEIVYSPGANFDRAVSGIQEHMLACADKVAAALPWVVPTPEVTLEVGELGPAATCHLCVGAGGHEGYDGEWIECSCQRAEPQGEPSNAELSKLANDAHHRMVDRAESDGGWYGFSHSRDAWEDGFATGYRARAASAVTEQGENR